MTTENHKTYVDARYAERNDAYGQVIADIEKRDCCPFCPESFKWHKHPILEERDGWFITQNSWPYKNAKHHYLIIPRRHIEHVSELEQNDLSTVFTLVDNFVKEHNIPGGGVTMRFGDTRYTGATVVHLHFHFISPEIQDGKDRAETVVFPIG